MRTERQLSPRLDLQPRLWTGSFVMLCSAIALAYVHNALMLPTIPLYVDHLGGSALVAGLALLAFSLPSVLVRPLLGQFSDSGNLIWVLGLGLVGLTLSSLMLLAPLLSLVFAAGVVRGLGWAGLNTGGYTALATAAPPNRRGEASGYYTGITASTTVFFPAIAIWLIEGSPGFEAVFLLSCASTLAAMPFALALTHPKPLQPSLRGVASGSASSGLIDSGVLLATGLNLCSTLATPASTAFLPLYARSMDIENISFYYVLAGVTGILMRPLLGQRSDSLGRGPSIALGLGSQLVGLLMLVSASALPMILAGGVFTSLGSALTSSATTALAMDKAAPGSQGKSMATFSTSFQMGLGFGSVIAGALAAGVGYRGMYAGTIAITLVGLGLLVTAWGRLPRLERSPG